MEDIRARKYTLNKVPDPATTSDVLPPNVKRDAHDVILEFIRSRPPLKPVCRLTIYQFWVATSEKTKKLLWQFFFLIIVD